MNSTMKHKDISTSLNIGGGQPRRKVFDPYDTTTKYALSFDAYFKESVDESALENHRVRRCKILYYLEDDTMQVVESKVENSGMPQGNFVKRHRIPRTMDIADGYYSIEDIDVGTIIEVYGRSFHVVDANQFTRKYLEDKLGREVLPGMPVPTDQYEEDRRQFMSRETGSDPTVNHKIRSNPMKVFAEATLGKTVNNSGREAFFKYDRCVLHFTAMWDDRDSDYGELREYSMNYFLQDDTVSISAAPHAKGHGVAPVLLKRGELPRNGVVGGDKVHWTELYLGQEVDVYGRKIILTEADAFTREFYDKEGRPLGDPVELGLEPPKVYDKVIPPHTGFGSEEDSLVSCTGSLMPTAPKRRLGEDVTLRFTAEMESPFIEDAGREFIITVYGLDTTVAIREPPKRNSGVTGGTFLSRMKVIRQGWEPHMSYESKHVTMNEFQVGGKVVLNGHVFIITGCDAKTSKFLDER
ncbi:unnamed protein product [Chrysoparadoxa australica]